MTSKHKFSQLITLRRHVTRIVFISRARSPIPERHCAILAEHSCRLQMPTHQNSPSAIFLTANRSLSIAGTSSHSRPPLAQAPTYSPPGPRGFLNFTNCTASPPKVSTYTSNSCLSTFITTRNLADSLFTPLGPLRFAVTCLCNHLRNISINKNIDSFVARFPLLQNKHYLANINNRAP